MEDPRSTRGGGLAIAASGGGPTAVFTAGFLDVINREGIEVGLFSGVSAGAILVGGYSPRWGDPGAGNAILEHYRSFGRRGAMPMALAVQTRLREVLIAELGQHRLEDAFFRVPTVVAATNLHTRRTEVIGSGPAVPAILASAAHPFMRSVWLGDSWYGDGAATDYLALKGVLQSTPPVEGLVMIDLSDSPVRRFERPPPVWRSMVRLFEASVEEQVREAPARIPGEVTVLRVRPRLMGQAVTDFSQVDAHFALGQRYAELALRDHFRDGYLVRGGELSGLSPEYTVDLGSLEMPKSHVPRWWPVRSRRLGRVDPGPPEGPQAGGVGKQVE